MAYLYQYFNGMIRSYKGKIEPFGARSRFICESGKKFTCPRQPGSVYHNIVWYKDESYQEAIRAYISKKASDLQKAYHMAEGIEREIDNLCYLQSLKTADPDSVSVSECFENHKKMWKWIAKESELRGVCTEIRLAFYHFGWAPENVYASCWACQAAIASFGRTSSGGPSCSHCPIEWPNGHCQPLILGLRKAKDSNDVTT